MKTKKLIVCTLAVLLSFALSAQENEKRWGFEMSGGASAAVGKIGDTSTKIGGGLEGIFHYRFLPHTGMYAGWGWNKLGADASFLGNHLNFEETGYVIGLQFKHPMGDSPVSYFLRVGGLYNHIETENSDGNIINDTKHGLGFQVAGGIDIPLGSNWSLTPGVKFNSLSREIDQVGGISKMNLNYLSLRVGILKNF